MQNQLLALPCSQASSISEKKIPQQTFLNIFDKTFQKPLQSPYNKSKEM